MVNKRCRCVCNVWHSKELIDSHKKTKKMLVRSYPYELNIRLDEPLYKMGLEYEYKYSEYPLNDGTFRVYLFLWGHFLGGMSEIEFENKFIKILTNDR